MKLIKLNTDHYVVVTDSEIKEGDWYYWEVTKTIQIAKLDSLNRLPKSSDGSKKITHSTQPIEQYYGATDGTIPFVYHKIIELPLSEIKELIGEVDAEKKVRNEMGIPDYLPTNSMSPSMQGSLEFGIKCYNQALEDNKDKKYTEEDMMEAMLKICEYYADSVGSEGVLDGYKTANQIIQSLQPKTEWEVEFIDGKLKLK